MNSRERVSTILDHREPDRVPLDLGGSVVSGIHAQCVYQMRQALRLDKPGTPVKIIEPYQNLGEIKPDLMDVLGIDIINLRPQKSLFGFEFTDWKPWLGFDDIPLLVPGGNQTEPASDGNIYMYPDGDKFCSPSAVMLAGGWHFESINRQPNITDEQLNVEDNLEEFQLISDDDLDYIENEVEFLFNQTDKAILANFGGTSFGNIGLLPGVQLKKPKGIRDATEWYISLVNRKELVYKIFERQCLIGIENLSKIFEVVKNRIQVIQTSGTDFGGQNGLLISPKTYRDLFKPFHKIVNDWIHKNTSWKIFIHTDGDVMDLIPDFIEVGFDIFNPVQTNIPNMNPEKLKSQFGDQITFWGAGIDTQHTLPFGTPDECRQEVINNLRIFAPGGGFVFSAVHNIQPGVPIENLLTVYQTLKDYGNYPIQ